MLAAELAGALTALGAALKDPGRVSGLVIVDGLYFSPVAPEESRFFAGLQLNYQSTLRQFVEACLPEPGSEPIKRWGMQFLQARFPGSSHRFISDDLRAGFASRPAPHHPADAHHTRRCGCDPAAG